MNLTLTGSIKLNRHKKIELFRSLLRFRLSFERYFAVRRKSYAVSGLVYKLTFDSMFVIFFNSLFNHLQYVCGLSSTTRMNLMQVATTAS